MENKVILPKSFYETQDKPDGAFVERMQRLDPKLIVYWNRFRGRWIIDRYNCDYDGHRTHDSCPRLNVHVVQTEEGNYHPLNDRVIEWLRGADVWNQNTSPEEINRKLDEAKAAHDAGSETTLRLHVREGIRDEHLHSDSSFPTVHPR